MGKRTGKSKGRPGRTWTQNRVKDKKPIYRPTFYRALEEMPSVVASLDQTIRHHGGVIMTLADTVADTAPSPLERILVSRESSWIVGEVRRICDRREAEVILKRYGFEDHGGGMFYADIAREWGLSRERIRQLAESGMRKLRKVLVQAR